jgi:hypothetical protein
MRPLLEEVHERIRTGGPLPYDAFMRLVLYHPDGGYYATRVPGSGSDYGTSPSLTPRFGRLVARELGAMWDALGRPDPFTVVEAGAGRADLAAGVLESAGRFGGALRWRFIERFAEVADLQRRRLGALAVSAEWSEHLRPGAEAPAGCGCVLAHEVLDNFPVHVLEIARSGDVCEVYVGEDRGRLVEQFGPLSDPGLRSAAEAAAAALAPGHRLEVNLDLDGWVGEAAAAVARGYLLIVDYGDVEPDLWLCNPGGTMVTYGADGFGLPGGTASSPSSTVPSGSGWPHSGTGRWRRAWSGPRTAPRPTDGMPTPWRSRPSSANCGALSGTWGTATSGCSAPPGRRRFRSWVRDGGHPFDERPDDRDRPAPGRLLRPGGVDASRA